MTMMILTRQDTFLPAVAEVGEAVPRPSLDVRPTALHRCSAVVLPLVTMVPASVTGGAVRARHAVPLRGAASSMGIDSDRQVYGTADASRGRLSGRRGAVRLRCQ